MSAESFASELRERSGFAHLLRARRVHGVSQYERRADYRPPHPNTGDYSCDGKSLADCVA